MKVLNIIFILLVGINSASLVYAEAPTPKDREAATPVNTSSGAGTSGDSPTGVKVRENALSDPTVNSWTTEGAQKGTVFTGHTTQPLAKDRIGKNDLNIAECLSAQDKRVITGRVTNVDQSKYQVSIKESETNSEIKITSNDSKFLNAVKAGDELYIVAKTNDMGDQKPTQNLPANQNVSSGASQ
jgi:hypothetical protein